MTKLRVGLVALFALLLAAIPGVADAKFTRATTPAALSMTTGTLAAPKNVTVPGTSSGSVSVSWSASAGAPSATRYYVTRTLGTTTTPACSSSASNLLSATSCTDTVTASGSYTYVVTAVFYAWTTSSASSSKVVVSIASAGTLDFTQSPQSNRSGLSLGTVIVALHSPSGAVLTTSGVQVVLALSHNTTSGTLSGTVIAATGSNGAASFSGLSVDKVGSYTLDASAANYASDTSASFTITAGQAASVTVASGSGQKATTGTSFANPLVALVTDAAGNPVAGTTVGFSAPASGASATFSNNNNSLNVTSGADGRASITLKANATKGSYSVLATASGAGQVSFSLTNR